MFFAAQGVICCINTSVTGGFWCHMMSSAAAYCCLHILRFWERWLSDTLQIHYQYSSLPDKLSTEDRLFREKKCWMSEGWNHGLQSQRACSGPSTHWMSILHEILHLNTHCNIFTLWPWPLTYDLAQDIHPFDLHATLQVWISINLAICISKISNFKATKNDVAVHRR